jgi:RNA binding exosome subunit
LLHISTFIHATEDPTKVIEACHQILSEAIRSDLTFMQHKLLGHHRNPIILLEATIRDPAIIKESMTAIAQQLKATDKQRLLQERHRYLDEKGNLYLRFDKQAAYKSQLAFSQADPIRVKIKLRSSIKHTNGVNQDFPDFFTIYPDS